MAYTLYVFIWPIYGNPLLVLHKAVYPKSDYKKVRIQSDSLIVHTVLFNPSPCI